MKLTKQFKAEIRRAVIKASGVRNPTIELGARRTADLNASTNALNWAEDADLVESWNLQNESEIADHAVLPGAATLDCYVYSRGDFGGLECNCYVTIKDGKVVDCHQDDLAADKRTTAILGVPFSKESE